MMSSPMNIGRASLKSGATKTGTKQRFCCCGWIRFAVNVCKS